jgi:hypothetical protein
MRLSVLAMPLRTRVLLTPRKAKQKASPKNSSLKKKGGGAPIGACRIRIEKRCGARPFSSPLLRGDRGHRDLMERARSPFGAPPRHPSLLTSARLRPRFLEPPDANGRTLSGTSAASTSRSGTCRTGRCPSRPRAQCIAALHENRSRSALRSTLAKASLASGILAM